MIEVFQIPFMFKALIASLVTGGLFSYLGVYIVLRRIVFVSMALSQVAACGYALGYLLHIDPYILSLVLTVAVSAVFSVQQHEKAVSRESIIGFIYVLSSALGILFVAKSAKAESHILNMLSGNILTVTNSEVYLTSIICAVAIILHILFRKQFMSAAFDPEFAKVCGINSKRWDFLFYLILGVVISVGINSSGVLLLFSYLILPAMTALLVAKNMKSIIWIAVSLTGIINIAGLYYSFKLDLPSGPLIITVQSFVLLCAFLSHKVKLKRVEA